MYGNKWFGFSVKKTGNTFLYVHKLTVNMMQHGIISGCKNEIA